MEIEKSTTGFLGVYILDTIKKEKKFSKSWEKKPKLGKECLKSFAIVPTKEETNFLFPSKEDYNQMETFYFNIWGEFFVTFWIFFLIPMMKKRKSDNLSLFFCPIKASKDDRRSVFGEKRYEYIPHKIILIKLIIHQSSLSQRVKRE